MGTHFTLTLYAPDSLTAQRANAAVNARMDSLNQVMSDYLDGSEINRLSGTAGSNQWVRVSTDLFAVLQKARTIATLSNGRFDPTIGPLSQLWRRAVRRGEFPTGRQRRQARRAVSYRFMQLDSTTRSVKLLRSGMRLTKLLTCSVTWVGGRSCSTSVATYWRARVTGVLRSTRQRFYFATLLSPLPVILTVTSLTGVNVIRTS